MKRADVGRWTGTLICAGLVGAIFWLASLNDQKTAYYYCVFRGVQFWGPLVAAALLAWFGRRTLAAWYPLAASNRARGGGGAAWVSWRRANVDWPGRQGCGYDLTGDISGRCPECGCEIDADRAETARRQ